MMGRRAGYFLYHKGRAQEIRTAYGAVGWQVFFYLLETATHVERDVASARWGMIRLQQGEALFSFANVARQIGRSETAAKDAVRRLVDAGFIKTRRARAGSPQSPTVALIIAYDDWHRAVTREDDAAILAKSLSQFYRSSLHPSSNEPVSAIRVLELQSDGFSAHDLIAAITAYEESQPTNVPSAAAFFGADAFARWAPKSDHRATIGSVKPDLHESAGNI